MENMKVFKKKLAMLSEMLRKVNSSHSKVKELKRSVYILEKLLTKPVPEVYWEQDTAMVRYSLN